MAPLRVLVACEFSGIVREAFRTKGHQAYSCDLLPSENDGNHHIWSDVKHHLSGYGISKSPWDLMIAHPPCTYTCSSGLHWNKRIPGREAQTDEAIEFFRTLLDAPISRIAIENPIGCISTRIRKPDQIIQPWMFGDDASKATCLWLKNVPPLKPTNIIRKKRYANQTPSGQNKLGPGPDRWKERSRTYPGIAKAMAEQWGSL